VTLNKQLNNGEKINGEEKQVTPFFMLLQMEKPFPQKRKTKTICCRPISLSTKHYYLQLMPLLRMRSLIVADDQKRTVTVCKSLEGCKVSLQMGDRLEKLDGAPG